MDKGGNLQPGADCAAYYTAIAAVCGTPCFIWDNAALPGDGALFGPLGREGLDVVYPEIVDGIIPCARQGTHGE